MAVVASAEVSVLVVEDHPALRDGLRLLLQANGLRVAGTAGTAGAALDLAARRRPDVVLLDIALPGADGIDVANRMRAHRPEQAILLYTASEDPAVLRRALKCGAAGIASKARDFGELAGAIRAVAEGRPYLDPRLMQLMATTAGTLLSPRERQVVDLLAAGRTSAQVAEDLTISPMTAETHVRNAMRSLGVHTRAHAVAEAVRLHEIEL
jgi:two-component system nitrate/nitrite response regulator NarL